MKLSVIIPTFNGAERIGPLLDSLAQQSVQDFEVIASIDGSTDNTEDLLKSHQERMNNLRFVYQKNKGRASCRNLGVRHSRSELILFIDDDMLLPAGFIADLLEESASLGSNYMLTGTAALPLEEGASTLDKFRVGIEKKHNDARKDLEKIGRENYRFTTQLLAVPKPLFERIGGFKEGLRDSEDFELSIRALNAGVDIWYSRTLHAMHRDSKPLRQYIQRKVQYWVARTALGKEYPEIKEKWIEHFPPPPQSRFKRMLFPLFDIDRGWNLFLSDKKWNSIIPEKFRFKLLDIVLFSSIYNRFRVHD